jgi:hypothetical protein
MMSSVSGREARAGLWPSESAYRLSKTKPPSSIGCQFGSSIEFEGQSVVKLLKEVRQAMADTQEQIEQACHKFQEYDCLLSIPGFGPTR